jgi:twinkle protein
MSKYKKGLELLGIDTSQLSHNKKYICCPKCSHKRKTAAKRNQKVLGVSLDTGCFKCNHCDFEGRADSEEWINRQNEDFKPTFQTQEPKPMKHEPIKPFLRTLNQKHYEYLNKRGISQETANKIGLGGDFNSIAFNYFKDNRIVGAKYRKLDQKFFWQHKGCDTKYLYNLDNLKDQEEIILTEGEFDVLTAVEIGFLNAGSVAEGAPNVGSNYENKLRCLKNSIDYIKDAKKVILCFDNDPNGQFLTRICIERFGADRCFVVEFPDYETHGKYDLNSYYLEFGREATIQLIERAKKVPINGVKTVNQVRDKMMNTFKNGYRKGIETNIQELKGHFSFYKPWWNLFYGIPNSGKSEVVLFKMMCMSVFHGWKWAVFSPEHYPAEDFFNECVQKLTGRGVDLGDYNRLSEKEYLKAIDFIDEHFFFVYPSDDTDPTTGKPLRNTFDTIIQKIKELKLSHGIDGFLIDPINQVAVSSDYAGTKDEKLEMVYLDIDHLCKTHFLSGNIVAHPRTMYLEKGQIDYRKPTPYEVAGGAMNYNKAYTIVCIHRPFNQSDKTNPLVEIDIQKVKKHKIAGKPACVEMYFDYKTGWYHGVGTKPALHGFFDSLMDGDKFEEESDFINKLNEENNTRFTLEDCPF